jgi:hypothetical protein
LVFLDPDCYAYQYINTHGYKHPYLKLLVYRNPNTDRHDHTLLYIHIGLVYDIDAHLYQNSDTHSY